MAKQTKKKVRFSVLEERGWDSDLRRLYLPDQYGWFVLDCALAAESTPEWQRDAERVAEGRALLYTRNDLKERGWSVSMIRSLLGEPRVVAELNQSGTRVLHLYHALDVEAAEAEDGFVERRRKAARRSAAGRAATAGRAAEVRRVAAARAAELVVTPPESLEQLEASAIAHQNRLYDLRGELHRDPFSADRETIDRWCRNYLRHQCSAYDRLLDELTNKFAGVPGVTDIYDEIVRPRIDALVDRSMADISLASGVHGRPDHAVARCAVTEETVA